MRSIISTEGTGCLPAADSAESSRASAPLITALETSETSARVGRGCVTIDSSIWVATITGLLWRRARSMSCR